jgi:putative sterol carrier protein
LPGVRTAISSLLRGASDRRLERTIGSRAGLALLFRMMARRFVPEKARGFVGAVQYRLRATDGGVREWVVEIDGARARARPGRVVYPRVTLSLALADFARLAAGELDPGRALLTGRLDVTGDLAVATRLGDMFGAPSTH